MIEEEKNELGQTEKLVPLNPEDQPLSPEQLEDIEGPMDEKDPFEAPDFSVIKDRLAESGLEAVGEREIWSGGSFGPLFRIKVKDNKGWEGYVIERAFTEVKDIERRFAVIDKKEEDEADSEPRYEVKGGKEEKLVIDYLYNEEKALKALQHIKGIPKFYGAAYDNLLGSTLEEFINGYDLSLALAEENPKDKEQLIAALDKVKEIYKAAAEAGYVHTDPLGSTIMVDEQKQPYLVDWYLYERGAIDKDEDIKEKYLEGLAKIEEAQRRLIQQAA